jgi:hypothetical protein
MSPTLVIFKKDARHLWPHIALWIAVLVSSTIADPWGEAYGSTFVALAAAYLIVVVIQQEALPGDRQYWRTRPFHWHDNLRAKALFILAFVNAAVFLTHAVVLAAYGIPVIEHLTTLLRTQLFLTALILLPAAALAVVTSNLSQAMLFAFFGFVALVLVFAPVSHSLPALQVWIGASMATAVAACAGLAILWIQYRHRRTPLARLAFLSVALTVSLQLPMAPPRPPSQQVNLDPGTARILPNRSAVELRIHIDGIPAGVEPVTARIGLRRITKYDRRMESLEADIHDFAGGTGWLIIYDWEKFFVPLPASIPVLGYSGDLDILLFTQPRTFPIPLDRPVLIPGIGPCSQHKADYGLLDVVCLTPYPRASLAVESPGTAKQWIIDQLTLESRIPTPRSFTPLHKFITPLSLRPGELPAARLVFGQLLGRRHLTFTLPNLPLIPQK